MTKLNKIFILTGVLLLAGGILLILFPGVLKYVFSLVSICTGTALLLIARKGKKAEK